MMVVESRVCMCWVSYVAICCAIDATPASLYMSFVLVIVDAVLRRTRLSVPCRLRVEPLSVPCLLRAVSRRSASSPLLLTSGVNERGVSERDDAEHSSGGVDV